LGGRESDHPVGGMLLKAGVEIMEIPSSSSENDYPNGLFRASLFRLVPRTSLLHRTTQGRGRKSF